MTRKYYLANRKRILARCKVWRDTHRKQKRAQGRAYHRRNRAAILKKHKAYYRKHKRKMLAQSDRWRKENPEKRRKICRRWYRRHRKVECARRRAHYWKDIEKTRKRERDQARKHYPVYRDRHNANQRRRYRKNINAKRDYFSCYSFFKKLGIRPTEKERQAYLCQKKTRKEFLALRSAMREGAISERKIRQQLTRLASKTQSKPSIKMRRRSAI